jgi:hypothetical protein
MHRELHQRHHFHPALVVLARTERIRLDHSHLSLPQVPSLDRARKSLQIRQQLGMKSGHMVHQETCNPGKAERESRLLHRKVQRHSYQHHIVGTGSCMPHSTGLNNKDGHMDSHFPVEVVEDVLTGAGQSDQHSAVGFELQGLESCGHCFGPLQLSRSGIELVGQNSVGIAMFRFEVQNNHYKIFEEPKHLADLVHLVVDRIAVDSNCCSFAFVGQPCSRRNNRSERRRKRQMVVESALAMIGLDSLRMDFGTLEPVG